MHIGSVAHIVKCDIQPCAQPGRSTEFSLSHVQQHQHQHSHQVDVLGSERNDWAGPCRLDAELLVQRKLSYDLRVHNFVAAAEAILGPDLGSLHHAPIKPYVETPPSLRRGQIQAQMGASVSKAERKDARNHAVRFERTEVWKRFLDVYHQFVHEYIVPQCGNVPLLYQRKPILRVVLPGSVPPSKLHCDADYYHDSNEVNFWVPFSRVWGSNSLWSESAPGRGDYAPFECEPGQLIRF